jgi:hypothetical protein
MSGLNSITQAEPQGVSDEKLIRTYQAAYQPAWERGEHFGCHVDGLRAVLTLCGSRTVEPVAWCCSQDFQDAALKRQSFNGWRERHSDCDLALYALPVPQQQEVE